MPFIFNKLENSNLEYPVIIDKKSFTDDRGFFTENYKKSEFILNNINIDFVQDNLSCSKKGSVRGMHYQLNPKGQAKLCSVIKGKVLDFAIDVRKSSPTFKKVFSTELSEDNNKMFYIPVGFAHGFIALEDNTMFSYKCSNEYSKEHEAGIRYDDPELNLNIESLGINLIISPKDLELPFLKDAKLFE